MPEIIRTGTRLRPVPLVPEIRLHQASDPISLWQRTELAAGGTDLDPPYWAFAWAGGQALARYLLDHPEAVRGRRVIDIASGSGLVAIAAARAGAAAVAAYVYQRDLARRVMRFLERSHTRGAAVLAGDFGRAYLPRDRLTPLASYDVSGLGVLEDSGSKRTTIWALSG